MPKKEKEPEEIKESKEPNKLLEKRLEKQLALIKKHGATQYDPEGGCVASKKKPLEVFPTGLDILDHEVIGAGGLPKGRLLEIFGLQSSGKSALAMFLAGRVQQTNPNALVKFYDLEHSFIPSWGKSMGMDLDRTIIVEPFGAESMAEQIKEELSDPQPPEIIIIDSLAVLTPESVMEKDIKDYSMRDNMARADFLTKFFNSLVAGFWYPPADANGKVSKDAIQVTLGSRPTTIFCVNHAKIRTKTAGNRSYTEWYTPGGVSLDFAAALRLHVFRKEYEKAGGVVTHQIVSVVGDKNKIAPPKRECEIRLSFSGGMEQMGGLDYLQLALNKGLAEVKGPWIFCSMLPDGKIQGREKFNAIINSNEELKNHLLT
jgi:recombination protein RecA